MRNKLLMTAVAVLSSGLSPALALADTVVAVDAARIFAPTGFDDNDNTQVVVDGLLPSTCFKLTDGWQEIDHQNRTIAIEPRAIFTDGPCIEVLVPYSYEFNFGELAMGDWLIKTTDGSLQKKMTIAEATSSGPDDQLYASVDNAYIQDEGPQGYKIVLEGTYSNTCMVWDKTQLIHKDALVLEVLPVVKLEQRDNCENRTFPFKGMKVALPSVTEGRYLLHVRSMNGRAVNRVFTMGFAGPTN